MSAVCPKCGVAVVPGYVKCPKCHTALPSRAQQSAGGTAVVGGDSGKLPIAAIAAGLIVAAGIVVFFATRKGSAAAPPPTDDIAQPAPQQPAPIAAAPVDPTALPPDPVVTGPARPDPTSALNALTTTLQAKRLWGTVTTSGARVDVRSGSCSDAGMAPVIDAAVVSLREGGLTKLRCLEQSGAVVFERDL